MITTILRELGITSANSINHNPSYDELFRLETERSLEGFEKGVITTSGAISVDTGTFTGRSPKDKYFVNEPSSQNTIWWADENNGSDNKPITKSTWKTLKNIAINQLIDKDLFVQDAFCGANPNTRLKIRLITEIAWAAHFAKKHVYTSRSRRSRRLRTGLDHSSRLQNQQSKLEIHGVKL